MGDAIGIAGVGWLPAEVKVGLARVTHRQAANPVIQIEQRCLVGYVGRRLGRNQSPRRGRRDRRLRVAGTLANEAARANRAILKHRSFRGRLRLSGRGFRGRAVFLGR